MLSGNENTDGVFPPSRIQAEAGYITRFGLDFRLTESHTINVFTVFSAKIPVVFSGLPFIA